MTATRPRIAVKDLTMAYGSVVIQRDLTFSIQPGEIFIIMGGSGWQEHPVAASHGLVRPAQGEVL